MDGFSIEKFRFTEINEVADILRNAFISNPAYSIIFKKRDQRADGLFWLFKTNLLILNQNELLTHVVKEKSTGRIIGTYTLIPPQGVRKTLSAYSQIGLPRFILKFGMNALIRMLKLDKYNKRLLAESIRIPQYHYLSMVVINEEYRGKGIGSYIIKDAITSLIASNTTCKIVGLTTQLPENVTFYSRLGFEKLDDEPACFEEDEYFNCNMQLNLDIFAN